MSDSDTSSSKPIKITVAAILLLIAGIALFLQFHSPAGAREGLWFYDTQGNKFVAAPDAIPPITINGVELVRAYAFGCGSCKDESKLVIKHLEKFTPEAIKSFKDIGATTYAELASESWTIQPGRLVKKAADAEWVDALSDAGKAILASEVKCGDGSVPKVCGGPESK